MELNEARRIVEQVAEALDYAHRRGMVHRDVKPANIMLTEEGQAILTDFGLARMVEGARFTQTGVAGTPYYMSPEQGQSLEIYSLGIVLYEMLTGRPPYVADTPVAIVLMHVQDPLPPPRRLNPAISPFKALEKEPEKRFQRASELAMAFWEACKASQAEAIKCARCGASLKPGQRFCRRCGSSRSPRGGAPLTFPEAISPPLAIPEEEISLTGLSCPQCKAPLAPGQNFCPRCGFILESERIQTGLSPLWIVGGVLALLLVASLVFLASLMIVPEVQKARGASLATPPPPLQVQKAASFPELPQTESPTPTEKPSPTPDVAATSTAIAALIRPTLTARAILLSTPSPTTDPTPTPFSNPTEMERRLFT
ncbi:MAG: protein kinase domain-containing protein [Anaerolineae bacterium]